MMTPRKITKEKGKIAFDSAPLCSLFIQDSQENTTKNHRWWDKNPIKNKKIKKLRRQKTRWET